MDNSEYPYDIRNYIKFYQGFIPKDECQKTIEMLENENWRKHSYNNSSTGETITYDDDLEVFFQYDDRYNNIQNYIDSSIKQYLNHVPFKFFETTSKKSARFNRYTEKTRMRVHVDHIHTCFDGCEDKGIPILTSLAFLNDNFTGGQFQMLDGVFEPKQGDIVVFPSVFLYPHQVLPIESGVRYSAVNWYW